MVAVLGSSLGRVATLEDQSSTCAKYSVSRSPISNSSNNWRLHGYMVAIVFRGLDELPVHRGSVGCGPWMRMQAELCGLIATDTLLLLTKMWDRPGKAERVGF